MEYEFTLSYQLSDSDRDIDELIERLGRSGCDDATIGCGHPGRLGLMFTREAASARAALASALNGVRHALPSANLIEAGPDFVGLTEAAEIAGMSRQNLRKLMLAHSSFPPPFHDGNSGLWHLADLLNWLQHKNYPVNQSVLDVSIVTRQLNAAREARLLPTELPLEIAPLVV